MLKGVSNKTGDFTVLQNAKDFKSGKMSPHDFPSPMRVWKDDEGKIWTLDHRRLASYRLAGLDSVPVEWVTQQQAMKEIWKMDTVTDGLTTILRVGDGNTRVIR
ncbi:ParB/Srx family N-terminal domain-containing protein [Thorsellia kenyensis]|uniref:ParB/Srx family N-terminal domain-containing protein n=1 Tax=Thorsellia kenyensis TaxID=1549888 RepID=A0ABV6C921_9GAMM